MNRHHLTIKTSLVLLLALLTLVSMSACGKNAATASTMAAYGQPAGAGATPESGINETPRVNPNGHYESIVVANDIVYVGSDNGNLYALQAGSGRVLWHYDTGSLVSIIAVQHNTAYAIAGANYDTVYALDASKGAVLWHHQVASTIFGLALDNEGVYINTNSSGSQGAAIYALRAGDGALLWQYTAQVDMPEALTVLDGIVYARASDMYGRGEYLSALQASDGHLLWSMPTDEFASGQPVEANGVVYIATSTVYAVQATTGKLLWHFTRFAEGEESMTAPTVVNGVVYVDTQMGTVYALRASDGSLLWHYAVPASFDPTLSGSPVVVNGMVYVAAQSGTVYALRASDGSLLWQHNNGRSVFGQPLVVDGVVHVTTQLNNVYGLNASSGALLWQHATSTFSTWLDQAPPRTVSDDAMYVGTEDGVVDALRSSDGMLLWSYKIKEKAVPPDPVYGADITFRSSVSYEQALKLVTDLGLQTQILLCEVPPDNPWKPVGDQSAFPDMLVTSTPIAAPGWLDRLKAMPQVAQTQEFGAHSCPLMPVSPTPLPTGTPVFLPAKQAGTYVRVTFASTTNNYNATIDALNNLGFRLANPCYERARAQGTHPAWNPMGQETTFASSHTLLLATTTWNSTHWQDQLHAISGIVKVEAPVNVQC
jgi:outer membrane protein assembly factor BamB